MNKFIKVMAVILAAVTICTPFMAKAEPEETAQPLKIESFILNSNENERINATLKTTADVEIHYSYKVAVVTDISQNGQEVASGRGKTGEDVSVDINMSNINTYDSYRFKISVFYTVEDKDYVANSYSKVFDYTQQTYADDLGGRDLVIDMVAKVMKVNWAKYDNHRADSVVVLIDVDGKSVVEEVVPRNEENYEYYFDQNTKQITLTLKQVFDGKLSQGITDAINIVKSADSKEFYLKFPEGNEQFENIWNIEYVNATANKVYWKTDSNDEELELEGNGTFLVDMENDNSSLYVKYTDNNNVVWEYQYLTTIASYAPTVSLLEQYNGSSVSASSITITGKVDDAKAAILINGETVDVNDNGMFSHTVDLEGGENIINVEASNSVGKTSRTTLTIYKSGDEALVSDTSFFGQYGTLIVTFSVSTVLLIILIIVVKKGGHKDEEEA